MRAGRSRADRAQQVEGESGDERRERHIHPHTTCLHAYVKSAAANSHQVASTPVVIILSPFLLSAFFSSSSASCLPLAVIVIDSS